MRIDLLVNHFVYAAITDGYIVIFEKDFKRNYIHVRDVADCFCYCIKNADKMKGLPYNVGLDDANLSKEQLKDIFTGKKTNWKDVGGKDMPIAVVYGNKIPGTNNVFMKQVMGGERGGNAL